MGYGAFTTPYKNAPEMDSGISVSNNAWATGTFGGYVELSDGRSAPKLCGLTCHHVLRPPPQPSVMTHEVFSELCNTFYYVMTYRPVSDFE